MLAGSWLTVPRSTFRYFAPAGRIGTREGLPVWDARFTWSPALPGGAGSFFAGECARQSNRNFPISRPENDHRERSPAPSLAAALAPMTGQEQPPLRSAGLLLRTCEGQSRCVLIIGPLAYLPVEDHGIQEALRLGGCCAADAVGLATPSGRNVVLLQGESYGCARYRQMADKSLLLSFIGTLWKNERATACRGASSRQEPSSGREAEADTFWRSVFALRRHEASLDSSSQLHPRIAPGMVWMHQEKAPAFTNLPTRARWFR